MPRCPRGALELPEASPQLGTLGFGGSAGGGFPFNTSFSLSPCGGFPFNTSFSLSTCGGFPFGTSFSLSPCGGVPFSMSFSFSTCGGFPFGTSFGLSPCDGFLLECEKVLAGRRVAQPQRPPPRMKRQPQHLAVQSRRTARNCTASNGTYRPRRNPNP